VDGRGLKRGRTPPSNVLKRALIHKKGRKSADETPCGVEIALGNNRKKGAKQKLRGYRKRAGKKGKSSNGAAAAGTAPLPGLKKERRIYQEGEKEL